MKITLVRPPTVLLHNSSLQDAVPPIGLAYLASSLKQAGHEVVGIDALGEGIEQWGKVDDWPEVTRHGLPIPTLIQRIPADSQLIGVNCMFSATWPYVHTVLQAIREAFPNVPIVVGGEHITAVPEYVLDTCPAVDYCIKGEGERAIVMLTEALSETSDPEEISQRVPGIVLRVNGRVVHGINAKRIRDVGNIPKPDWTVFPIQIFLDGGYQHGVDRGRSMPILASRGCPYKCTFCSSPQMWTTLWRARPPADVVNEMKEYIEKYHVENFDFYDLTAIIKKAWIIEFCKKVIEELPPIKWQLASGTRSEALDEETAKYLYDSGCCNIIYAPESANIKTLALIKKKVVPKKILASMRAACKNNLEVKANILIGFPGERKRDTLPNTVFFIKMAWIGVQDATCFPFSPYPGSELFQQLINDGRIKLDDDYLRSLFNYQPLNKTDSYSEYMSDKFVTYCTVFNMLVFYAFSFLFRPIRAWHLFNNLFIKKKPVSRVEVALFRMMQRSKQKLPD